MSRDSSGGPEEEELAAAALGELPAAAAAGATESSDRKQTGQLWPAALSDSNRLWSNASKMLSTGGPLPAAAKKRSMRPGM